MKPVNKCNKKRLENYNKQKKLLLRLKEAFSIFKNQNTMIA